MEFLGGVFFMVYDIDIHQLNLGQFRNLKFLDEISFKQCFFCAFFNNKCKMTFKKKKKPYQRGRDFIEHCIIKNSFVC
jgi:hypothetical protein